MLRITVRQEPTTTTIELEGKLAGPWVEELERCWRTALAEAKASLRLGKGES